MSVVILDVGHGNSALILDERYTTLVDVTPGITVSLALEHEGITRIDQQIISHADSDHCGGVVALLLNEKLSIGAIWLNADLAKKTATWGALRRAIADAELRGAVTVHAGISTGSSEFVNAGHSTYRLEILSPSAAMVLDGGAGHTAMGSRPAVANTMSAVVRISAGETPMVVLAGDIDHDGWNALMAREQVVTAPVLVFPHHGGQPGGEIQSFVRNICESVQPAVVAISLGRDAYSNPNPEVVKIIREVIPKVRVVCTQLSKHCAPELPSADPRHLSARPARGRIERACCGGSLEIEVVDAEVIVRPSPESHGDYISETAPSALCRA